MKLDTFLLADAAATAPNKKLFIHGGGITRIDAPDFPYLQTQFGIVLRFSCDDETDAGADHTFGFRILQPDGSELYPAVEAPIHAPPDHHKWVEGEEVFRSVVIQAGPVAFEGPGVYAIEIKLDGEVVRTAALPVVHAPDAAEVVVVSPNGD